MTKLEIACIIVGFIGFLTPLKLKLDNQGIADIILVLALLIRYLLCGVMILLPLYFNLWRKHKCNVQEECNCVNCPNFIPKKTDNNIYIQCHTCQKYFNANTMNFSKGLWYCNNCYGVNYDKIKMVYEEE